MGNPFSWQSLTTPPATEEVFSLPALLFLVLFGVGFVFAAVLSGQAVGRVASHPIVRRMVRRDAGMALWVFGAGLFFFGIRALGINPFGFGEPIWLWLCLLAALALAIYFVYYWRRVLPVQLRAFDQERVKRRYLQPKGKAVPATGSAARSGKTARSS